MLLGLLNRRLIFTISYVVRKKQQNYSMRAIISHGLYIFYPIFHFGLYCRAVSITNNLCTKQENSSIFEPKILGLQSRAGYKGPRMVLSKAVPFIT